MSEPADEYDRLKAQKDAIERKQPIRPIRSEADHKAVLARIDALMDAEPGTARGDELDVLVDLVQLYESKEGQAQAAPEIRLHCCHCGDPFPLLSILAEHQDTGKCKARPGVPE